MHRDLRVNGINEGRMQTPGRGKRREIRGHHQGKAPDPRLLRHINVI